MTEEDKNDMWKYIDPNWKPQEKNKSVLRDLRKDEVKSSFSKEQIALQKYQKTFLRPPKITDRKTVYLSCETRDRVDAIVRKLGMRGASVSGFIENLAKEHLRQYENKHEQWKKLWEDQAHRASKIAPLSEGLQDVSL